MYCVWIGTHLVRSRLEPSNSSVNVQAQVPPDAFVGVWPPQAGPCGGIVVVVVVVGGTVVVVVGGSVVVVLVVVAGALVVVVGAFVVVVVALRVVVVVGRGRAPRRRGARR